MDTLNCFVFYEPGLEAVKGKKQLFVEVPTNIKDRQELFVLLYHRFDFPRYFGFNWDALVDSLMDLEWIPEKNIVILHRDIPFTDENDRQTYLKLLEDVIGHWKQFNEHTFTIYFPKEREAEIKKILTL